MAAKNEECRQGKLAKRQQYQFRSPYPDSRERETGVTSTKRHNTLLTIYSTLRLKGDVTSAVEMITWLNFARHLNQRVKEVFPQSRSHQVPGKWPADKILRNYDQRPFNTWNSKLHLVIRKCPHKSTFSWMLQTNCCSQKVSVNYWTL